MSDYPTLNSLKESLASLPAPERAGLTRLILDHGGAWQPLVDGDEPRPQDFRERLRKGNLPLSRIIRENPDRFAPRPETVGGISDRGGAAPAAAEIAQPAQWNPDVGPVLDAGRVPTPARALNLPDPSRPESTAGETAKKFVENVPAMFKRSVGGLVQAQAEADIPAVGMPGLMFSLDPKARKLITMGTNATIDKMIEAITGRVPERTLGEWGADIFDRATADLEANAPNIDPESFKGYAYDISSALVQMAPAVGASVATRNPNIGLMTLGAQVYGDRYGESRAEGRTPG